MSGLVSLNLFPVVGVRQEHCRDFLRVKVVNHLQNIKIVKTDKIKRKQKNMRF